METAPLLRPSSHLQETPSAHCNGRLHTCGLNQPWIRNLSGGKNIHKVPKCKFWNGWPFAAVYIVLTLQQVLKVINRWLKVHGRRGPVYTELRQHSISHKEGTWASADSGIYLTQGCWDPSLARMKGGPHCGFSGTDPPLLLRTTWHKDTHTACCWGQLSSGQFGNIYQSY